MQQEHETKSWDELKWAVCRCGRLVEKIDAETRQVLKLCDWCHSCVSPVSDRFQLALEIIYGMGADRVKKLARNGRIPRSPATG